MTSDALGQAAAGCGALGRVASGHIGDPRDRARAWVARWRTLPLLDGEPISTLLVRDGVDLTTLIDDELVSVLAEGFATFDELEERRLGDRLTGGAAPGGPPARPAGDAALGGSPAPPASDRIEVPADTSVRTRATVLWARSRGIEALGPDGRPAMAASTRPSWIRGWLRYRFLAPRDLRKPVLDAWRASMALWEALGRSKEFRMSLITDDGIDIAPLVLPVLAHGVDEVFPEAVARRNR